VMVSALCHGCLIGSRPAVPHIHNACSVTA
jgi:hypothetical protein